VNNFSAVREVHAVVRENSTHLGRALKTFIGFVGVCTENPAGTGIANGFQNPELTGCAIALEFATCSPEKNIN
jgi:hypothetical protein